MDATFSGAGLLTNISACMATDNWKIWRTGSRHAPFTECEEGREDVPGRTLEAAICL